MSELDPTQQIVIEPKTVACPGHGEHLRAQWPKGFLVVGLSIMQYLLSHPEPLFDEWGIPMKPKGNDLDVKRLNDTLARKPMCYFVPREVIVKALSEADIARIGMCRLCGLSGLGGPYSVDTMGTVSAVEHVCFQCACNTGERIHTAHPNGGVWQ